jgi:hypothetical protein
MKTSHQSGALMGGRGSPQRGALRPRGRRALPLLLLAAACGGDEADQVRDVGKAVPAVAAAKAEPVLTAEGYGPLRIGMTLAEVAAAMGPDSDPAAVGGPEPERCDQFRPARAPEGLLVMIEEGRLTRISLYDGAQVATDKGLRVGAARAEVRAAYGAELRSEPHEYESPEGEYLTLWTKGAPPPGSAAGPNARGIRYEVAGDGRVATIHAGGPSIQLVEGCL